MFKALPILILPLLILIYYLFIDTGINGKEDINFILPNEAQINSDEDYPLAFPTDVASPSATIDY